MQSNTRRTQGSRQPRESEERRLLKSIVTILLSREALDEALPSPWLVASELDFSQVEGLNMWRKDKAQTVDPFAPQPPRAGDVKYPEPKPVRIIDLLKDRRLEKIEKRKALDKEIAQLDHDITFMEIHPENARVIEFVAQRFNVEPGLKKAWNPSEAERQGPY